MNETTTRRHYSLIIANTEITRTVCAAWSNTVKYRPKNQCYIIIHYFKKERRYTLWRYVPLCAHPERWVSFQNVSLKICPTQSPNNKLTEMREHFLLFLHCAFGILLHRIAKFVVTSDPLEINNMVLLIP